MKKKRQNVARQAAARRPLPELPKELLDQLAKGPMTPAEVPDLILDSTRRSSNARWARR